MKIHGSAFQVSGIPDILGCYRGQFVGLEVKRPEIAVEGLSARQRLMFKRIRQAGGIPRVVVSTKEALEVTSQIDKKLDKYEGWST